MHETRFVKEIIDIANEKLKTLGPDSKIIGINVKLSPLSHVKPQTLNQTFVQIAEGEGHLKNVRLNIKLLEIKVRCKSCGNIFLIDKPTFNCQHCKGEDLDIQNNREFFIESIEVEEKS